VGLDLVFAFLGGGYAGLFCGWLLAGDGVDVRLWL